jgi:hypothetical protein
MLAGTLAQLRLNRNKRLEEIICKLYLSNPDLKIFYLYGNSEVALIANHFTIAVKKNQEKQQIIFC